MYCSKCGAENKDDSLFCTKCGEKILDVNVKDDKGAEIKGVEKDKTNLFSAHLLNIIAFCLPVLMTLGMFLVIPQMSKNDSDSAADLSVTVEPPDNGSIKCQVWRDRGSFGSSSYYAFSSLSSHYLCDWDHHIFETREKENEMGLHLFIFGDF